MTSQELRQKFLDFFKAKGHAILPSASLIPENDPTVLFTTAGMHPLVPYLLGEKHPLGSKLASCQKCIRTSDIAEVGDDWHLTFFEMLGNWSLGSYWKKEAIEYSWEFLTDQKWLGLDKNKISVSVFAGDEDAPFDKESFEIWKSLGLPEEKIVRKPKSDNWWGPAGKTGPCGPDTEIFYNGVEIWNDVFMEYNKVGEGKFEPLKQKNVDTGMGLERTVAVLNGYTDVYEIDLLKPLIEEIEELSGKKYTDNKEAFRIIAEHIRAAVFILAEKLEPSNIGQGYVLRRLIRRAIRYGYKLGIHTNFTAEISQKVFFPDFYRKDYPELIKNRVFIQKELEEEEAKFSLTLERGLNELNRIIRKKEKEGKVAVDWPPKEEWKVSNYTLNAITPKEAFDLYQTYGFPLELINDELAEHAFFIDEEEFKKEFKKHQELSRTATAGKFKSGLADNSEIVVKLHTAAHLLLQAIRQVLGGEIMQKGSNITAERLRLDFNFPRKLTEEELKKIEDLVNEKIKAELEVKCEEMPPAEAMKQGALGAFGHKYGDVVKVYSINNFSKEICAGPHVGNTRELGHFKILKEESSSSGVRRIKAITTI